MRISSNCTGSTAGSGAFTLRAALPRGAGAARSGALSVPEAVVVVPYDRGWPDRFDAERQLLERALGPWLDGGIHHVGSTAVPGLAAKPTIDMMAGVRDLLEARAAFGALAELSYVSSPHRPGIAHHFDKTT